MGVRVFGVSRDSHWSHRAWKDALDADVPLLSDWNGALANAFGRARVAVDGGRASAEHFPRRRGRYGAGSWRYEDSDVPDFDEPLAAARALLD